MASGDELQWRRKNTTIGTTVTTTTPAAGTDLLPHGFKGGKHNLAYLEKMNIWTNFPCNKQPPVSIYCWFYMCEMLRIEVSPEISPRSGLVRTYLQLKECIYTILYIYAFCTI
jgi:hypothetical protein